MNPTQSSQHLALRAFAVLVAVAAAGALIIALSGGGDNYTLKLRMDNASGVRPGSQVLLGGVEVGKIDKIDFDKASNTVTAKLKLKKDKVHVGQGVRAAVVAANLLGEKYVALQPGDRNRPLPSGTTLPVSATSIPTDLDQIVDVLDRPTSERLGVLLHEAGIAVAGRKNDVNAILGQFPASLDAATKLLNTVVNDNHTLADLVSTSNTFIGRLDRQEADLRRAVGASGAAASVVGHRADDLRDAIAAGPRGFESAHDWLHRLALGLRDVEPSLRRVADALPQADSVLRAVAPFTSSAVPTLNRAAAAGPQLSRLAKQATPTIKQGVPTFASLNDIAKSGGPFSAWAGLGSSDLFNIFGSWSQAIQFRDGISHIFNGDFYTQPGVVLTLANMNASPAQKRRNLLDVKNKGLLADMGLLDDLQSLTNKLKVPAVKLPNVRVPSVKNVLPKVPGLTAPRGAAGPDKPNAALPGQKQVKSLLDYLLKP